MSKRVGCILLFCWVVLQLDAQTAEETYAAFRDKVKKEYSDFKSASEKEYIRFRDSINIAYAQHLRQSWEKFKTEPAIPVPPSPDPPTPPVYKVPEKKEEVRIPDQQIPWEDMIPMPFRDTVPEPVVPIYIPPLVEEPKFVFVDFYGESLQVRWSDDLKYTIPELTPDMMGDTWERLSQEIYNPTVMSCIYHRDKKSLSDWAYFQFLAALSEKIFGSTMKNEAVLLQFFVLTQSGYALRLAIDNGQLVVLFSSDDAIYGKQYYNLDDKRFYASKKVSDKISISQNPFPGEKKVSMLVGKNQQLGGELTVSRNFKSKKYADAQAYVTTNSNLMKFYDNYPKCDWKIYANTGVGQNVKSTLYPALQRALQNKTEVDAANLLINFVQTAFEYKTDEDQFGYERPFFSDELFYYSYSDCEDRSILFANLVRDLLHLEVVLLHYPGHLATAVAFKSQVSGHHLLIGNKKFIICDPTYIGAPIGLAMPDFVDIRPNVVVLNK